MAETREFECEMLTWACGERPGVVASADGFFGRSTIVERGRMEMSGKQCSTYVFRERERRQE
jgi:hypothetical protein